MARLERIKAKLADEEYRRMTRNITGQVRDLPHCLLSGHIPQKWPKMCPEELVQWECGQGLEDHAR